MTLQLDSDEALSTSKKICLDQGDAEREKKKRRTQKYRPEWEKDKLFSQWLGPDTKCRTKAVCKWCNSEMFADITVIKKHGKSKKHLKAINLLEKNATEQIPQIFTNNNTDSSEKTKRAEIKLSGFLAMNNLPFSVADELIPCLKSSFPDSKILEDVSLGRTKATKVITNVIAQSHKKELAEKLIITKFSILTDETTDTFQCKSSCVVIRFFDKEDGKIVSRFWDLSCVFPAGDQEAAEEGATGRRLYEMIIKSLEENKVPLENVIGLGCDGASVNTGDNNSIISRFRESCPGIVLLKCICHSLHLAASKACEMHMPRSCEDLARNVHNYVEHSAKRIAGLAVFQDYFDVAVHRILHPAQTRWLSLVSVVNRMLEQWEPLKLYFMECYVKERTVATESIANWLQDPFIKLFYLFLSWVLPKVVSMNEFFQSDSVVVTTLGKKMSLTYKEVLTSYLELEYVAKTPLSVIEPSNREKFIPLNHMYLGLKVREELKNPYVQKKPEAIKDFLIRSRDFMVKLCEEIKKRFDFDSPLMKYITLLHPTTALSIKERVLLESQSLMDLVNCIPRGMSQDTDSMQRLDDEWRRLPLDDLEQDITQEKRVDVFWAKIANLRDIDGNVRYVELPRFALSALSIPHSNAECERVFSKYNLIKTRNRNRLLTETIEGVMLASQCLKTCKEGCSNFEPSRDMLSRMTSSVMYENLKDDDKADDIYLN